MFPVAHILDKLMKMKSFSIWNYSGDKLTWRSQKWALHPALLHLMQLPLLTSLKLHWINDFLIFDLIHRSSLKHLSIQYKEIVPPSTAPLPLKSVYLHEYDIGLECTSATRKLAEAHHPDGLPIVNFTELAKVTANCNKVDIYAIQTIFIQANQLQNINLTSKPLPLISKEHHKQLF